MYIETMVAPAIPDFIKDFAISYNTAPWILTAYLVVAVVMTPVMARLADIHCRKTILLSGLVITHLLLWQQDLQLTYTLW
jgi:predicted MFS family arabinose efflux permease